MSKNNLETLKKKLETLEGRRVVIKENGGRKSRTIKGTLSKTYPNMFLILADKTNEKCCYRYVDILTNKVQLNLINRKLEKYSERSKT